MATPKTMSSNVYGLGGTAPTQSITPGGLPTAANKVTTVAPVKAIAARLPTAASKVPTTTAATVTATSPVAAPVDPKEAAATAELAKEAALTQSGNAKGASIASKNYTTPYGDAVNATHVAETPQQTMDRIRAEQGLPPLSTSVSPAISPASSAVSSTAGLHSEQDQNTTLANGVASNIAKLQDTVSAATADQAANTALSGMNQYQQQVLDSKSFSDTTQGKDMMDQMNALYAQIASGTLTDAEKASVQSQVDAVKAQYDQLIAKAESEKARGMGKSTVAVGEAGGFMNTQFAGLAALAPTNGGDFVGAGGELERIKSAYDENISTLQSQQIQAMSEAKLAAEKAIKTGKQEDLVAAQKMYEIAKAANDDKIALANDKATAVYNWQKQAQELQKYQRDTASATVDAMAKAGITADSLPAGYLDDLDRKAGYAPGTSAGLMEVAAEERSTTKQTNQVELATKMNALLTSIPVGETVTVNGVDYKSLNKGKITTFSEDDGKGNTTIVSYNEDTNTYTSKTLKGVSKVDGWQFSEKNGVGIFVNPNTHETQIAYDTNQPNNGQVDPNGSLGVLTASFPDGTKGPVGNNPALAGQCGAFVNAVTGIGIGDSYKQKMSLMDQGIGFGEGQTPPQAGDVFVMPINGSANGHTGIVVGSHLLADGTYQVDVMDSNWHNDGTIDHHSINSSKITGYASPGLKPEYSGGVASGIDTKTALANYGGAVTGSVDMTLPENKPYNDALNRLTTSKGLTKDQKATIVEGLNGYLASGDKRGAREFITDTVFNQGGETEQAKVDARRSFLTELDSIQSDLQTLKDNGIDTGLLKGTEQEVLKAVHQQNPALDAVVNRISQTLIKYRHANTGAAFSDAEKKAYDDLFPSIGQDVGINMGRISAFRDVAKAEEKQFLTSRIGSSVYDELFTPPKAATPSSSIVSSTATSIGTTPEKLNGFLTKLSDLSWEKTGDVPTAEDLDAIATEMANMKAQGMTVNQIIATINEYYGF